MRRDRRLFHMANRKKHDAIGIKHLVIVVFYYHCVCAKNEN